MAEVTTAAPASYKQPSRKGKKAWRKNVDLTEVQSGLDTVRDEVIKGGVIAEKTADELFTTDIVGDEQIAKQQKSKKLLKADEIIALRSAVPGLDGRKRKSAEIVVPGSSKRQKNGKYVTHKELQRLKRLADGADEVSVFDHQVTHDPWAEVPVTKDARFDFLEEAQKPLEPKTLKHAPKSLAVDGSRIPAVRKPEAGKSYNPLVGEWQAVLEREGAAAVEQEMKRLADEAAALEAEERAATEAAKVEAAEKAEYATDYDSAWESEWDGIASGAEDEVHTQKQAKRKTPSERNKIKARKEREAREQWEKKQKERDEQLKQIKRIAREVSAKDKQRQSRALSMTQQEAGDSSDDQHGEPKLQRRRFGQLDLPDAPLEVVLPDELEDSLRRLKPEGNLLTDRYRNMLISGKLEMRKKQWQRKQAKTERTEKWSYKDWKLK